jgi:hypothetical protein
MMRKKRVGNIFNALKRDTGALLDRQRVVGRLKLNKRTFSAVARMYVALESVSAGIDCEFGAKPAEERPLVLPMSASHSCAMRSKLASETDTHTPQTKGSLLPKTGVSKQPRIKKLLVVDDALIGAELTAAAALSFRQGKPRIRRDGCET